MATSSLFRVGRSALLRLVMLGLLVGLVGASVQPARAALDYCSTDPVFVFQRTGSLNLWTIDVQVMVPVSRLPLSSAATLSAFVPSNVATTVVNPPNPIFPVVSKVYPNGKRVTSDRYPVKFTLFVPRSSTEFPVRLVLTDPVDGSIKIIEGVAGKSLAVYINVGR